MGKRLSSTVAMPALKEDFDRTRRFDFWNDPDRWEGVDDPRKTMIWQVRRPDVIDVRPKAARGFVMTDNGPVQVRDYLALRQLRLMGACS